MNPPYKTGLFIFRRDLRLEDNTGLNQALLLSESVIPAFFLDPRQLGSKNQYRSVRAIQFMLESLHDLDQQLKQHKSYLLLIEGAPEQLLPIIIATYKIDAIFLNEDYTPFSHMRDENIKKLCTAHKCMFHSYHDLLLNQPELIKNKTQKPYIKFTPFYKRSQQEKTQKPAKLLGTNFYKNLTENALLTKLLSEFKSKNKLKGGTKAGVTIFKNIESFKNYSHTHDIPSVATTYLSAYLKFGCISVRQAYHAIHNKLGSSHPLLRQLYWRDFFTYVAYHFPAVFGAPYNTKYKRLWWSTNKKHFNDWCQGMTGFPIIDAGMRELNETGFMHNRVRMIVASFLTKDLHINWLWGEQYFAQTLIDYDPALNNGNWQWCASTGTDAQPYFRIFNPWLQQKKFDPQCVYIKQWIPELKDCPIPLIHKLLKNNHEVKSKYKYPLPIVNHDIESKKAKKLFQSMGNMK